MAELTAAASKHKVSDSAFKSTVGGRHREKTDERVMESIDNLLSATPEQLAKWLDVELGSRFSDFKDPFIRQKIDGRCVGLLTESHLKEMVPDSAIGDRLHVLSIRDKIIR